MAQCRTCGAELSLGALYCGACGSAIKMPASAEEAGRPRSVGGIFTASAYLVQARISESHRSLYGRGQLGSSYHLSTLEIKQLNGALIAIVRHTAEGTASSSLGSLDALSSLPNLSSLLPSLLTYSVVTPDGVRVGEFRRSAAVVPNRPYLTIRDPDGRDIAVIIMRVAKKPGAGFFGTGVTIWAIESPEGVELARIDWGKGNRDWIIQTSEGSTIAEVQSLDEQDSEYQTSHQVRIIDPSIDPFLVVATFFATPPGTR